MDAVSSPKYVAKSELRAHFAAAMSGMYKGEVPLYADLIDIVQEINKDQISSQKLTANLERLTAERHGAIRVGTPQELRTVRRIFNILDMHAVGYYDLSVAGLPMHATAFRPICVDGLEKNPFRVFTTLLRPELLVSDRARELAKALLGRRCIFSEELMRMLDVADSQSGWFDSDQSTVFIQEALRTFSWQPVAASTLKEYQLLKDEHPILADISCFRTAHINHLTPRTLDISLAQKTMVGRGMKAKERIEGPPPRQCPILLRQTSFLALEEKVSFHTDSHTDSLVAGTHTARFGEIEQRGAALTPKGRDLYDDLLSQSTAQSAGLGPEEADAKAKSIFAAFPDTWESLRSKGLIYCQYEVSKKLKEDLPSKEGHKNMLEKLIAGGYIESKPITYEDFLPFSAAGIFRSNLAGSSSSDDDLSVEGSSSDQDGLENALGISIHDMYEWYEGVESSSLDSISREFGVSVADLMA